MLGAVILFIALSWRAMAPMLDRDIPVTHRDIYTYSARALILKECLLTPCAINDVGQRQVDIARKGQSGSHISPYDFQSWKWPVFVGPPVYQTLMILLVSAGASWHYAWLLLNPIILGGIVLSFALLGRHLVGEAATGIAMILFALGSHEAHLYFIDVFPNTLCIGIALFSWWLTATHGVRSPWKTIPICTALLILTHPIGQIYSVINVLFLLLLAGRANFFRLLPVVMACGVLILLPFFAIGLEWTTFFYSSLASMDVSLDPARSGVGFLKESLFVLKGMLQHEAVPYGGGLFMAILVGGGCFISWRKGQLDFLKLMTSLLVMVVVSSLYRGGTAQTSTLARMMVSINLLSVLMIGLVIWEGWKIFRVNGLPLQGLRAPSWKSTVMLLLFGVVLSGGFLYFRAGWANQQQLVHKFTVRSNQLIDPDQPRLLLERAQPGDFVYFTDPTTFNFFLLHGAKNVPVVAGWFFANDPIEREKWLQDNTSLRFAVVQHPILIYGRAVSTGEYYQRGAFLLQKASPLLLHAEHPLDLSSWEFLVQSRDSSQGMILQESVTDDLVASPAIVLTPHKEQGEWISPPKNTLMRGRTLQLFATKDGGAVRLAGIRPRGSDPNLYWPWDRGITLTGKMITYSSKHAYDKTHDLEIRFNSSEIFPVLNRRVRLLMDRGSTTLVEVLEHDKEAGAIKGHEIMSKSLE